MDTSCADKSHTTGNYHTTNNFEHLQLHNSGIGRAIILFALSSNVRTCFIQAIEWWLPEFFLLFQVAIHLENASGLCDCYFDRVLRRISGTLYCCGCHKLYGQFILDAEIDHHRCCKWFAHIKCHHQFIGGQKPPNYSEAFFQNCSRIFPRERVEYYHFHSSIHHMCPELKFSFFI